MQGYLHESQIQRPSADCGQDAGWWHALDASSTECEVSELVGGLVRGLLPGLCVETGCYRGQTTTAILRALAHNRHGRLLTLDTDPDCCAYVRSLTQGTPITVAQYDARTYPYPDGIDFAWIDTGDPRDRIADLEALLPHLAPHAVLAVHDTGTTHGLRSALRDWAQRRGWDLVLLPTPRGVGILVRRREGGAA